MTTYRLMKLGMLLFMTTRRDGRRRFERAGRPTA